MSAPSTHADRPSNAIADSSAPEREGGVQSQVINPWTWQDQFAFVQAHEVSGAQRVVYCSGQTSVDGDGNPIHEGDLRAQVGQALDNLETVLGEAGLDLSKVVRPELLHDRCRRACRELGCHRDSPE